MRICGYNSDLENHIYLAESIKKSHFPRVIEFNLSSLLVRDLVG